MSEAPNYKTTPDFNKQCPNLKWKGHVNMSKVQNYKTTPDFVTTYINFIYAFARHISQTTKLHLNLTKQCSIPNWERTCLRHTD